MKRRTWVVGGAVVLALVGAVVMLRGPWNQQSAVAQAPRGPRVVPVVVATATLQRVPVRVEALGSVTMMASVAIKTRVDSEITGVHFADGARVEKGAVLFTLDSRQIQADIRRVEAIITGAEATLEQALRDVQRYTELVARNATTQVTLNNSQTQVNLARATAESNKAILQSLKVQLEFCTIRAPIAGRIGTASVKVGNFARQADLVPLATINQVAPIYVSFAVPQRVLPDVRAARASETATLIATIPGTDKHANGHVAVIENTVDPATGMVMIRAAMPNEDELLWPGTLVNAVLTLRNDERVTVPAAALQNSQAGTFVFVVKDDAVQVRPVKVERVVDGLVAIESGLQNGEVVVTDGQLLLSNGTRVTQRRSGS